MLTTMANMDEVCIAQRCAGGMNLWGTMCHLVPSCATQWYESLGHRPQSEPLIACVLVLNPLYNSTSLQFYMLKQSSKYICQNQQHSICLSGCYLPPSHPPFLILCLQASAQSRAHWHCTVAFLYSALSIACALRLPIRGRICDSIQLSCSS